jgi:hypothetical protein
MVTKKPKGIIDDIGRAIENALKKPVKPSEFTRMNKNSKMKKVFANGDGSIPKRKPPQPPKKSSIKPPSLRTDLGKGRPAMTTKELDAYRKLQNFDKTVNDINKKPRKYLK